MAGCKIIISAIVVLLASLAITEGKISWIFDQPTF